MDKQYIRINGQVVAAEFSFGGGSMTSAMEVIPANHPEAIAYEQAQVDATRELTRQRWQKQYDTQLAKATVMVTALTQANTVSPLTATQLVRLSAFQAYVAQMINLNPGSVFPEMPA